MIPLPGYANLNESFDFMRVLFKTICPSNIGGCPGQETTRTAVLMGVVYLNTTFSNGKSETLTALLGDDCLMTPLLTQHVAPRAGFYLDCVTGSLGGQLKLFLLVEASQSLTNLRG